MAKPKYDTVVEAIHYQPDGQVAWVRAYQRRGPTFTDWTILKRPELVESLKAGKRIVTGKRVEYMAGTFEVGDLLQLVSKGGGEVIVTVHGNASKDHLPGLPTV